MIGRPAVYHYNFIYLQVGGADVYKAPIDFVFKTLVVPAIAHDRGIHGDSRLKGCIRMNKNRLFLKGRK